MAALLVILCALSVLLYMRLKRSREKRTSLEEGGSFDGSVESDDQGAERRRFSTFLLRCLALAPCKSVTRGMMKGGDTERAAREMDYWELRRATNNFGKSRLIGEGGFGRVYRAKMDDGSVLAVKRLNEKSSQVRWRSFDGYFFVLVEASMMPITKADELLSVRSTSPSFYIFGNALS